MALIGASDIWKIFEFAMGRFTGSKAEKRKRVEAWLDTVYSDLNELANPIGSSPGSAGEAVGV
jgi:hypothetical protein